MKNSYKLIFDRDTLELIGGCWSRLDKDEEVLVDRKKKKVTTVTGLQKVVDGKSLSKYIEEEYPEVKNIIISDVEDDIVSDEEFIRLVQSENLQIIRDEQNE